MTARFLRERRCLATVCALAILAFAPAVVRADTVASLLGNFTINQYSGLTPTARALDVHYTIVFGQLPALRELHQADADGDGVTTQTERDAYLQRLARALASDLRVTVDGIPVALRATRWTTSLPTEQSGFSLRFDLDLIGGWPAGSIERPRVVTYANGNYAGAIGWQEIVVTPFETVNAFDTDAFSTSLTAGLTEAIRELPAGGPLNERRVHLAITAGALPPGAHALGPRAANVRAAATVPTAPAEAGWLQRQTRRLIAMVSTAEVAPHVALFALLAAMVLGAAHAFSPGHGKTVVGAYLIGSRATARHAAFLGLTVTVTHTLGVFALGFATLFFSRYVEPERIFPILGFAGGAIVLGMGLVLLVQRWPAGRAAVAALRRRAAGGPAPAQSALPFRNLAAVSPMRRFEGSYVLASVQAAQHHAHEAVGWHSHGGTWHSHLPPGAGGEDVTWRSLLALGVSGGLVPCPSAMVLLLAAVALNKTAFGLVLVVAFSLGLALTLSAIGLAFLYARNRIGQIARVSPWTRLLPVVSAAAITVIGVFLCYGALAGGPV